MNRNILLIDLRLWLGDFADVLNVICVVYTETISLQSAPVTFATKIIPLRAIHYRPFQWTFILINSLIG